MIYKLQFFFVSLAMLANFFGLNSPVTNQSIPSSTNAARLTPVWTQGVIGVKTGFSQIIADDLNQDGKTDIVTCSGDHAYALNYTSTGGYTTIWYSEQIGCHEIAVADRDGNGIWEIYVATSDARVIVFDSANFQTLGTFSLPSGVTANDIEVADVDSDGAQEIVVVRQSDTLIYDANTFNLEWQVNDAGGNQVMVGNIDNDLNLEIVVNGNTAYVLNASLKTQKWAYSGGFGSRMAIGDVDGDNRAEIVYINSLGLYVFAGDTLTIQWQRNDFSPISAIAVGDTNNDGISEIISGNNSADSILGIQGSDGATLWSIVGSGYDTSNITVGDANNDGVKEIIWNTGYSSSAALFVGNWVTQSIEWSSDSMGGPLHVAAGDIDNDGQVEIVLASYDSQAGYEGGIINVYDGLTHEVEWSATVPSGYYDIYQMAVGQLDSDPALEVLVGGDNWYDTRLQSYDGSSQAVEWTSAVLGSGSPSALIVTNLDADAVDEIVVGLNSQRVQVFNGASNIIQWDSGVLDGRIKDVAVGDLDGDAILDLAVLTNNSVYVFQTDTWTPSLHRSLTTGTQLAIVNAKPNSPGELLLATSDINSNKTLLAWNGSTYAQNWQHALGDAIINDIAVADIDSDNSQEVILMGRHSGFELNINPSLLWIGSEDYPGFWEEQENKNLGAINGIALSDVDNDGQSELLVGSNSLIQVNEITASPMFITYLPSVVRTKQQYGIHGNVTENKLAIANIPLELRFYDGSNWSTRATTTTASDGSYSFIGAPSLKNGQRYYVLYQNTSNSNRLWTWHTQVITSYTSGDAVRIGDFDIAGIQLLAPANGSSVVLPQTFEWIPRPTTPSDIYEFDMYAYSGSPYFYPVVGYTNSYVLNSLPPGFVQDLFSYLWEIWVYSPDGGFGISYETRQVSFSSYPGPFTSQNQPSQPQIKSNLAELPRR